MVLESGFEPERISPRAPQTRASARFRHSSMKTTHGLPRLLWVPRGARQGWHKHNPCSRRVGFWPAWQGSNLRPLGPKPSALSTELQADVGAAPENRTPTSTLGRSLAASTTARHRRIRAERSVALGGARAERSVALGGARAERSVALGGARAERSVALGGARAERSVALGGARAERSVALGGAQRGSCRPRLVRREYSA